jgi:hypothetical protein
MDRLFKSDLSLFFFPVFVSMERKVKMTLDCKLLIWLPLPPAARRAVINKTIFESVTDAFFDELATVA